MADCTGFIEPLNLECLFVNIFAGSTEVFTFLAVIFIAAGAGFFKMNSAVAMIMIGLFAIIMYPFTSALYVLTVFIGGLAAFIILSRIMKI